MISKTRIAVYNLRCSNGIGYGIIPLYLIKHEFGFLDSKIVIVQRFSRFPPLACLTLAKLIWISLIFRFQSLLFRLVNCLKSHLFNLTPLLFVRYNNHSDTVAWSNDILNNPI